MNEAASRTPGCPREDSDMKHAMSLLLVFVLVASMGCGEATEKNESPEGTKDADGFVTTKSGLKYKDLKVGDGAVARPGRVAEVHYTGWLKDGKKFDSSRDHDPPEPFSFQVGEHQVIDGWDMGMVGMKSGGKRKLIIPADLAYGKARRPGIPPDSELTFEVELLKVTAGPPKLR
jgi:FKBP-type peptidyl-prolyl cis-trans isomerase